MRILVTGVAGFIGSRFCDYIIKNYDNISIIGVDDLSGGFIENVIISDRMIFIKGDITDKNIQKQIEEEFEKEDIEYIFHFASLAWECLSPYMRQLTYKVNVMVSAFLINCGIKYNIKRFIYTSSMAVYGHGKIPFDETLTPNPIDSYGISKYTIEMDLKVAYTQHNMEYCIIRPHNVIGINQNIYDVYRNVLGIWMYQMKNNLPITIYGDGNQCRAFSYIDDILPCLWRAGINKNCKNEIINLGGMSEISLNNVCKLLCDITKTKSNILYLEPRHEVKYAWSTYKKSIDLLDYKETKSLKQVLIEMWEWVQTLPIRNRKYFDNYEVDKGIYSYWKK
jgi:UDP-glucose 4-epimerase